MKKQRKPAKRGSGELGKVATVDTRRREVEEMLVSCVRVSTIKAVVREKYGAGDRTIDEDIRIIKDRWHAESQAETTDTRREALREQLRSGYASAKAAKNYVGMTAFARIQAQLDGLLTETVKHEAGESLSELLAACAKSTR